MKKIPDLDIEMFPRQSLVFQSVATEILYGGAAGGGKSHLARIAAIIWACQIPGLQVYFFRRQFVDIELNHLNGPKSFLALLAPLIEGGFCQWHKGKYQFVFWNGSMIKLCHVQKDQDVYNYLGAEMHVIIIDELSQFTAQIYRFLRSRLRMIGITVPEELRGKFPRILCCSNPGGPAHSFMKMAWVKAAPPEQVWRAAPTEGGLLRQFIPAKVYDNPALLDDDPEYINRLRGLGDPALVKAYLEGSFDIISGGMFDDLFNYDIHVIEPFNIPKHWYVDRAFDMGSARPFCVSWFAETEDEEVEMPDGSLRFFPRGTIIQIGEWYGWNGEPNEGCRLVPADIAQGIYSLERLLKRYVNPGPADNEIFNTDNYGSSIAAHMAQEPYKIEWVRCDKKPGSRMIGWQNIRDLLKATSDRNMEKPHLYFFNTCTHTLRTLAEAVRDKSKPEDVDKKTEDHALDTLRYRILNGNMVIQSGNFRAF